MTGRNLLVVALVGVALYLLAYLLIVSSYRAVHESSPPDQRFVAASAGRAFVADMAGMPTTTTTLPPTTTTTVKPVARTAPKVVSRPAPAVYGSGACGGDLPPCSVMRRESGGNIRAINRTGCGGRGCYGKWQFDPRTWAGYGGYQFASDAPESVQDAKARELWAGGRGCSHWNACA